MQRVQVWPWVQRRGDCLQLQAMPRFNLPVLAVGAAAGASIVTTVARIVSNYRRGRAVADSSAGERRSGTQLPNSIALASIEHLWSASQYT